MSICFDRANVNNRKVAHYHREGTEFVPSLQRSSYCDMLYIFPLQVQFLDKAVKVLSMCRNTLKYTYVFAFYLQKNNQTVIFEVFSCGILDFIGFHCRTAQDLYLTGI